MSLPFWPLFHDRPTRQHPARHMVCPAPPPVAKLERLEGPDFCLRFFMKPLGCGVACGCLRVGVKLHFGAKRSEFCSNTLARQREPPPEAPRTWSLRGRHSRDVNKLTYIFIYIFRLGSRYTICMWISRSYIDFLITTDIHMHIDIWYIHYTWYKWTYIHISVYI